MEPTDVMAKNTRSGRRASFHSGAGEDWLDADETNPARIPSRSDANWMTDLESFLLIHPEARRLAGRQTWNPIESANPEVECQRLALDEHSIKQNTPAVARESDTQPKSSG